MKGGMRLTEEQWRDLQNKPPLGPKSVLPLSRQQKYRNEHCTWQGLTFDSKKEMEDYKAFKLQEASGQIRAVIRQVSFPLQGSTRRIRTDFVIVEHDGRLRFVDSKGFETPEWKLKRQMVEEAYGIVIETI